MQVIKCNSNVMAITCHIFKCNALHYNYVTRTNCQLQTTFHYFENVIHYNYITITITITPGLQPICSYNKVGYRDVHCVRQELAGVVTKTESSQQTRKHRTFITHLFIIVIWKASGLSPLYARHRPLVYK